MPDTSSLSYRQNLVSLSEADGMVGPPGEIVHRGLERKAVSQGASQQQEGR